MFREELSIDGSHFWLAVTDHGTSELFTNWACKLLTTGATYIRPGGETISACKPNHDCFKSAPPLQATPQGAVFWGVSEALLGGFGRLLRNIAWHSLQGRGARPSSRKVESTVSLAVLGGPAKFIRTFGILYKDSQQRLKSFIQI